MPKVAIDDSAEAAEVREENENWHDKEAQIYDHVRSELWNFYEQRRISQDVDQIHDLMPGNRVVDIGSGTGNLGLKFANLGCEVEAVDISENMLEVQQMKVDSKVRDNINFHHSEADDFLQNLLDNTDAICFSSVLHHLPDYFKTLERAVSRLNEQGVIYIVHEPLPSKVQKTDVLLENFDNLLTPRSTFQKWKTFDKESDMVDYHIDQAMGIELSELKDFLSGHGLSVVEERRYSTWKSGILSCLDEIFRLSESSDFKVIAQK